MTKGNIKLKIECRNGFDKLLNNLEPRFKTNFWDKIHNLTKIIYVEDCDETEAIKTLMLIIEELLQGCLEKECTIPDLHYAQEIFNDIDFIYTQARLYDYYNGELYGLVEYLDHHNNLDDMMKEFKKFKNFFNRGEHIIIIEDKNDKYKDINIGDLKIKIEYQKIFDNSLNNLKPELKTEFWVKIYDLTRRIYVKDCDETEAIKTLILIIEELLLGCLEEKCTLKDLHYAQEIFSKIDTIYTRGKLNNYYSGELYKLIDYLDTKDNIRDMIKEFKKFRDYFNRDGIEE